DVVPLDVVFLDVLPLDALFLDVFCLVRPHRLTVRTPLFQGGNRGSIPLGGTRPQHPLAALPYEFQAPSGFSTLPTCWETPCTANSSHFSRNTESSGSPSRSSSAAS